MRRVHNALIDAPDAGFYPNSAKVILVDDLRVPIHIALGHYESATNEELNDLIVDLTHERDRRTDVRAA